MEREFPWWLRQWKICLQCKRPGFDSWIGKIPWRREWATHSSILTWRIPSTEEPGSLQSMGWQGVGYYWSTLCHTHTHTHTHTGKVYIKDLYTKAHGKALVQMVELQPGLNHFFHGTPFSLNDWDKQLFLRVGYLAGDLSKMNNVSYHIKENNWQNLLNMINSSFQLKIKVLQNMPATVTW